MRLGIVMAAAVAAVCVWPAAVLALPDAHQQVRAWRVTHEKEVLEEYTRFLAMPNVAVRLEDVEKNADYIAGELAKRGFATRLLSAGAGTPPAVFGELKSPGARRTVVFYAHYDGQPAGQAEWRSRPFTPVVRAGTRAAVSTDIDWRAAAKLDPEWRIYGRSASDDKAPIQAMLCALDALNAVGKRPGINVKVLYEGEEEAGSPHLARILEANASLLAGDVFVLSDGPWHQSGKPQVYFGARGVAGLELTVYGPVRPLHSGHYGNWAPNPAVMLTHLIDDLRDEQGRILVPGFYDDVRPLTASETAALAALPDVETRMKQDLELGRSEGTERLANAIMRPALNVRGIRVGDVGDNAANAISTEARASIDFRLVPDQTPERVRQEIENHLRARGWLVLAEAPDAATRASHPKVVLAEWSLDYPGYRADMDAPAAKAVVASMERSLGQPVLRAPMLGGSVPMDTFATALRLPIVGVPLVNPDNNQHAANENLRLQNLWDGIEIYAGLLTDLDW
jgi:acetylornithine deacetylase/succinyl-diaminopimelate desuccinylase-like protein